MKNCTMPRWKTLTNAKLQSEMNEGTIFVVVEYILSSDGCRCRFGPEHDCAKWKQETSG